MNIEYGNYTDRNDVSVNGRYTTGNITTQDNNVSDNRQDRMNQLSELKPGDTFTGTVVQSKNNTVLLHIDGSDAYVSASLESTDNYYNDQKITFQIIDNENGRITIKPLKQQDIIDALTEKTLLSQGITINDKNIAIVKELINNNLNLSKENIIMLSRGLLTIDGADISELVKLLKYDISINQENYNIYRRYNDGTASIQQDVNTIIDNVRSMYNANEKEFMNLMLHILDIDSGEVESSYNMKANDSIASGDVSEIGTSDVISNVDGALKEIDIINIESKDADSVNNAKDVLTGREMNIVDIIESDNNIHAGNSSISDNYMDNDNIINDYTNNGKATSDYQDNGLAKDISSTGIDINSAKEDGSDGGNNIIDNSIKREDNDIRDSLSNRFLLKADIRDIISQADADSIIKYMSKSNIERDSILHNTLTVEDVLKHTFEKDSEVKDSLSRLFENILKTSMSVKSEELYKGEVGEYFKKMVQKMDIITEFADNYMKSDQNITTAAQSISDNINFMNEMNSTMQFVQFPVQINGKEHQAELYVYRNKKNVNADKEEKTAFIRLDMEHLGNVEIYVKLYNCDVNMRFYVDNDDAKAILKDNIDILNERVTKLGYHVSEEFVKNEHKWNFEEDFMKKSEPYKMLKKTGFDVRA